MAESYVQTPKDDNNTGKKIRSITRSIDTNTVHEHLMKLQDSKDDVEQRVMTNSDAQVALLKRLLESFEELKEYVMSKL